MSTNDHIKAIEHHLSKLIRTKDREREKERMREQVCTHKANCKVIEVSLYNYGRCTRANTSANVTIATDQIKLLCNYEFKSKIYLSIYTMSTQPT